MKSFTLIEILVVISLILILTILIVPNFHLANSRIAVERAAYKLARDLRRAEEMALSSRKTPSTFGSALFPKGGYGIAFPANNDNSYILFADCDGSHDYDACVSPPCPAASCADAVPASKYPELIEEIFLESGVVIKTDSIDKLNSITFFPPDPLVTMDPISNLGIELTSVNDSSKSVVVSVNGAGLIEIKH